MRHWLMIALLLLSVSAAASETFRVGQKVLSVGDTATRTIDLLGTPAYKEPVQNVYGAHRGERWQYRIDGDRVLTVTVIDGKVSQIEDRRS